MPGQGLLGLAARARGLQPHQRGGGGGRGRSGEEEGAPTLQQPQEGDQRRRGLAHCLGRGGVSGWRGVAWVGESEQSGCVSLFPCGQPHAHGMLQVLPRGPAILRRAAHPPGHRHRQGAKGPALVPCCGASPQGTNASRMVRPPLGRCSLASGGSIFSDLPTFTLHSPVESPPHPTHPTTSVSQSCVCVLWLLYFVVCQFGAPRALSVYPLSCVLYPHTTVKSNVPYQNQNTQDTNDELLQSSPPPPPHSLLLLPKSLPPLSPSHTPAVPTPFTPCCCCCCCWRERGRISISRRSRSISAASSSVSCCSAHQAPPSCPS